MFNFKEAKKTAKKKVKQHYVIFVIALLLASFLGSAYSSSLSSIKSEETTVTFDDTVTVYELLQGNLENANKAADEVTTHFKDNPTKVLGLEIGYSRGVLAGLVNSLNSGSVFIVIYSTVARLLGDGNIFAKIAIVVAGVLMSVAAVFVRDAYRITFKRIFLEGYNYKSVKSNRFSFLFKNKKYINASVSSFVAEILETLWYLTIIGGPIASYAYEQVDYIIAENPSVKPMQAIKLSRRMMKGHKWEMFKYELSFIGWFILDICTFGLSAILFSNPYLEAFKVEYYVYLRKLAIDNKIEGYELLNDKYLYEFASNDDLKTIYADVVEKKDIEVDYPEYTGIGGFFAKNFGVILKYDDKSSQYYQAMIEENEYEIYTDIFENNIYPSRLSPNKESQGTGNLILASRRQYSVTSLILTFFAFSLVGWLWEVSLHLVNDGQFVNRGVLHGPWLPVYGSGVVLIVIMLYRFRKNVPLEFFSAIVLCGIVEYFTSLYLELTKGMRWWDYSGYFLNINGRICAEGLLIFGLGGLAAVYILVPLLDNRLQKTNHKILGVLCAILLVTFIGDSIYSKNHPNTGKGITDYKTTSHVEGVDKRC